MSRPALGLDTCRTPHSRATTLGLWLIAIIAAWSSLGAYGFGWLIRSFVLISTENDHFESLPDPFGGLQWVWNTIVPGYASFRYPAKWLVLFVAATSILAALGLERLCQLDDSITRKRLGFIGLVSGVALAIGILGWRTRYLRDEWLSWCQSAPVDSLCGPLDPIAASNAILSSLSMVTISILGLWFVFRTSKDRQTRMGLISIILFIELGWHAWADCYFVPESNLISVAKSPRAIDDDPQMPSWQGLALSQVRKRVGKFHLLVPERNWNAQLTLTPLVIAELRKNPDQFREYRSKGWLNAGWKSKTNETWNPMVHVSSSGDDENQRSQIDQVTAMWTSSNSLQIDSQLAQPSTCWLPITQDGGWHARLVAPIGRPKNERPPIQVDSHDGIQTSLMLPAGAQTVQVDYHMPGLLWGAVISAFSWLTWSLMLLRNKWKSDAVNMEHPTAKRNNTIANNLHEAERK